MKAAADHCWISCQSTLAAVETSEGVCVCTHVQCANNNKVSQLPLPEQQCFLSAACYLLHKQPHMNKNLHSVFYTVYCVLLSATGTISTGRIYLYIVLGRGVVCESV